ncbi:hypothetical protein [uncultured Erythrobacter sp.]|uniref:hypothetical protein n=1 Tax=uncultured Erythrobacter sp. TaxID=263913 RepID=UPI00260290F3|nr:hypothetical protein [uncultured Erythrobacter sp.]
MATSHIPIGADGFYHPSSEVEVIELVKFARKQKKQIRSRGATHSVAWSIYTDPVGNIPPNRTLQQSPPPGDQINIAFDKMRAVKWIDEKNGIVESEPGINLGCDPRDPFHVSTLENSFLYQIFEKGWAVNTLGGITHQTLAGFTATGSAGGSTRYAWDNAIAFRVVDGKGKAEWIDKDHPDFDAFPTSMGLLGIVTKLRLQLVPMYNIKGTERTTPVSGAKAPMDFFGPGCKDQLSLEQYLKDTPYTRIVWWPQEGAERIQTWEASRVAFTKDDLTPYQQFTPDFAGQTEQLFASMFFVLLGNTDFGREMALLWSKITHYFHNIAQLPDQGSLSWLWRLITFVMAALASAVVLILGLILGILQGSVRALFTTLMPLFNPMTKKDGETTFNDYYWRSLCMDNTVDDVFLGTEFTEIWVPIQHAQTVMNLYRDMFDQGGAEATGYFSTEIYGGPPSSGWIDPGYTDGKDEYKDGTVRIDVYWFRDNQGVPNSDEGFFDQYWDILKDNQIPFRLHWGKFVPRYDFPQWLEHYRASLPKFDDFMALRKKRDPDGLFFTSYWKERLTGSA